MICSSQFGDRNSHFAARNLQFAARSSQLATRSSQLAALMRSASENDLPDQVQYVCKRASKEDDPSTIHHPPSTIHDPRSTTTTRRRKKGVSIKISTCWSRSNDLWVMSPTRFLCAKVLAPTHTTHTQNNTHNKHTQYIRNNARTYHHHGTPITVKNEPLHASKSHSEIRNTKYETPDNTHHASNYRIRIHRDDGHLLHDLVRDECRRVSTWSRVAGRGS
jgi:hypothetical protein